MSDQTDRADLRTGTGLIPRSTIEEIVGYRNTALELYADAYAAIEHADRAIKAAHDMAARASPGINAYNHGHADEIEAFEKAVQLPARDRYLRTARRLTDIKVWSWIVERTELERLMDKEAKDTLRDQLRYIPERVDYNTKQVINGDEIEKGMPPVTVDNIYATLERFARDAGLIFRRGLANAFAKLDRRFRSHDGFKIGSRVILTRAFDGFGSWNYYNNERDTLMDIERAFCVLDGQTVAANYASAIGAIDAARGNRWGARQTTVETAYFRIRIFKNGNAHLWFTRDDLVEQVNRILAEWYGEVIGDGQTQEPDPFKDIKTTPAKRYGFFPTPDAAAEIMMRDVPLYRKKGEPPLTVLEPSAGTGNLARRCVRAADDRHAAVHVDCVEIQPALAQALDAEGIYRKVYACDFLTMKPDPNRLFDRVVMNPAFDRERDIDHVMHALDFLKPDGFLTAIMSAGTEFRETRKAQAFRALMAKLNARWRDLPAGSFAEAGTNVNTVILRVYKDGRTFY